MIKGTRRTSVKAHWWAFGLVAIVALFAARWWLSSKSASSALGPLALYTLPATERLRFDGCVIERVQANAYTYEDYGACAASNARSA